uniref:Uncharacterized protein n=1 Tax=Utricularia reniformis TaxID=192314 RepID=A0A1Y0B4E9_9LAMI|nr:hypothetical protein AEK19_MT2118 [Utricularia reniformis]ART32270.1 hypothetical protein AEK19_MT2118 [Utricularia reniformis]
MYMNQFSSLYVTNPFIYDQHLLHFFLNESISIEKRNPLFKSLGRLWIFRRIHGWSSPITSETLVSIESQFDFIKLFRVLGLGEMLQISLNKHFKSSY